MSGSLTLSFSNPLATSFCRASRAETILSPKAKDLLAPGRDGQTQISASCDGILRLKPQDSFWRETRQKLSKRLWAFIWIGMLLPSVLSAEEREDTQVFAPCSADEKWAFGKELAKAVPASVRQHFVLALSKQEVPYRGFAEAWGLKTGKQGPDALAFADYWLGRSFQESGLLELAAHQFNSLIAQPIKPATYQIQLAALTCMARLHRTQTSFRLSDQAFSNLPSFFHFSAVPSRFKMALWESAVQLVLNQIGSEAPKTAVEDSLALLNGGGVFEDFARSIWSLHVGRHAEAVPSLTKLVANEKLPGGRRNDLRILLARLHYQMGHYLLSIRHLELVDKQSNDLVPALIHLSSAQLLAGDYSRSIGAGVSLQLGGLKQVFAPEPLMVRAISLAELCQFPESLTMLKGIKANYRSSYQWLREHANSGKKKGKLLYPLAIAYLKKIPSTAPSRVASEWVRSSIFLSRQEAINELIKTRKSIPSLIARATSVREADSADLIKRRRELDAETQATKRGLKPGQPLPPKLSEEIVAFRAIAYHQINLTKGLPQWKKFLTSDLNSTNQRLNHLTEKIEKELRLLNQRMLRQLAFIVENSELIEAEIWNGASQDIVWQNAHPDYQALVKAGKLAPDRKPAKASSDAYDWGKPGSNFAEGDEIWEDELGSVQASLENNCANKEKYMKLQRGKSNE